MKGKFTNMKDEDLLNFLQTDPILEAEKSTGKSYKESKLTDALGVINFFEYNEKKERILHDLDDTSYSCSIKDYKRIIEDLGFQKVLEIPFSYIDYWNNQANEVYYIHYKQGMILSWDTYQKHRNSANLYFNWIANDQKHPWGKLRISGGLTELVDNKLALIGDLDAREAIRFNLKTLETEGVFLDPWVKRPFLWLLHHGDTHQKDYNYESINKERIQMLPDYVKTMIFEAS